MPPYRDGALPCVRCGAPMEPDQTDAGHELVMCPECGGAWMETEAFLDELRAAQPDLARDGLLEFDDGSLRRPCPRCGAKMEIVWIELLQLDRCADHGLWLDPGELERAIAGETEPPGIARMIRNARHAARMEKGRRRR